ncbi:MAG: class I SAM-dependent methyltransferase [Candidatus Bathycorpusculaceae bacterium]
MSDWRKKRQVMKRYDLTAHMYDMRYAEEQEAKFDAALKSLKTSNCGKVLDAGCGTGLLFKHVASKAETIVGLEISKKTLLKAKEHAENFRNVHLVLADADFMPFKNGAFHIVFAFTLIQNMPDSSKTLKEIKRVARDNAPIVVTGLKKVFNLQAFEKLLKNVGLKIVSLEGENLKCHVAICSNFSVKLSLKC